MSKGRAARWFAVSAVLAFIAWLGLVGTLSQQELCLGAACAVFSAGLSAFVLKQMGIPVYENFTDLMRVWRVPWYLLSDSWQILQALGQDLSGVSPAGSHLRAVPFKREKGARGFFRRVLAVVYTTLTPNIIVIGIDQKQELLLFHQIAPTAVPKMTKQLGAQG